MIAAGSGVPNICDRSDRAGTRAAALLLRGPAAPVAFVLLSCLLVQGCGLSEDKGLAEAAATSSRPAAIGGETVVARTPRVADASSAPRDTFADRFPQEPFRFARDSFAERFSPVMAYATEPARRTVLSSAAEPPARNAVVSPAAEPSRKIVTASVTGSLPEPARKAVTAAVTEPARKSLDKAVLDKAVLDTAAEPMRETSALGFAAEPSREILFGSRSVQDATFGLQLARGAAGDRPVTTPSGAFKVAALSPVMPDISVVKQANTRLVGFENSAFPYSGSNPRTGNSGSRYSDNRVLVHVPAGFDVRKPGVIVVFFHGHGATLSRDVRDRQLLPAQISESGVNAVLVAPQLAYDAADSSAGKFWERDGFQRFMTEAADQLARVYGDPRTVDYFANMPVVVVAYSGGFEAAAWSLHVGGLGKRVTGVVLMDAIYGHLDKFASWIAKNRQAFFVSSYTEHNRRRDDQLASMLREKGIAVRYELDGPLKPGMVALLSTRGGVGHRDFVTRAWSEHPVSDVLLRMAQR
jgi:hypothetical protein